MVGSGSTGIDDAYTGAVKVGGGSLMILTGLFHFTFFVVACRDLHSGDRDHHEISEKQAVMI
ncbi:hypothetical protein N7541_004406 [Penicillium brevicompactum]|uniref:Uncharacterized protein n=1 Tax=Penicillium brevicompactum TaxID=5074 RepID=A0A9W9UTT6_PENBR|nr:hypothetical protein N7541_004406 [Penicillium brevicompactum]